MNAFEAIIEGTILVPLFLIVTVGIYIAMLFGVDFDECDR